jgi:hypothetical protein
MVIMGLRKMECIPWKNAPPHFRYPGSAGEAAASMNKGTMEIRRNDT